MNILSQYGLIGNCRSAALVSKSGSIDWCCLPEFHSPAIFAGLLDKEKGGHFSIEPSDDYSSYQEYLDDTNVLQTHFHTKHGKAVLTDAFVAIEEKQKKNCLFPEHELLRVLECTEGTVKMKMEYFPSLNYGKLRAELQHHQSFGIKFTCKENSFFLLSSIDPGRIFMEDKKATAFFEIQRGEKILFSFGMSSQAPAIFPSTGSLALQRLDQTIDYWKNWIGQCSYSGLYQPWVKRSALALKLLVHAPSGAIVAAPTTSIPEEIGGERNWDYRYCWLRDASFTVRALLKLGFTDEVHAYMNWIMHATQLTRPKLQVVYSVFGEARLEEKQLDWLDGYRSSKPVRTGNGAHDQHQLDVYGDVLDAFYSYSQIVDDFDRPTRKFIEGLGDVICRNWNQPDNGIWEIRSSLTHHTHSKVMAWTGLDRIERMAKKFKWKYKFDDCGKVKKEIVQQVESLGYNEMIGAYTQQFGGTHLDASTLVFPLVDYCHVSSPRMASTIEAIRKKLSSGGLVYRYLNKDDGINGEEGCFGICSFWLVENLARSGKIEEARKIFDEVIGHAGTTGLLSEEIDPATHELLGNFPQGFTHIGLINAALSINQAYEEGGYTS